MKKRLITVLVLFFSLWSAVRGQEADGPEEAYRRSSVEWRQLDRSQWADLTKDVDYSERRRRNQRPSNVQDPTPGDTRTRPSFFGEGAGTAFARFLLIVLGAVAIAWLLRYILIGRVKNKKIDRGPDQIDIKKIEENIHEADLDDYIRQARERGHYNLAIRLYYLAILKELSLQKIIRWKTDKTNSEYLLEMRRHEQGDEFRRLTRIFERSWYGNRPLTAATFDRIEPGFRRFMDQLTTQTPRTV